MTKDTPTIEVALRDHTGTRHATRLRQSGRLPAVIYGNGDPQHVHVDEKSMLEVLNHGAHVIEVRVEDDKGETCLVRDLQFGFLGDNLIHLDFTRVNLDQTVTVNVPVNLSGDCKASKAEGAVLAVIRTELEVTCKVRDIPHELTANISDMELVLTIGELDIPEGVTPSLDLDKHICHITFVAEEVEAEEADVDAEGEGPEMITEGKDEESTDAAPAPEATTEESSDEG